MEPPTPAVVNRRLTEGNNQKIRTSSSPIRVEEAASAKRVTWTRWKFMREEEEGIWFILRQWGHGPWRAMSGREDRKYFRSICVAASSRKLRRPLSQII